MERAKKINHARGLVLRAAGLLPAAHLTGWVYLPLICAVYWLLFDGLFNVLRGLNWWSTGSEDPDDAKTDNFLQTLTRWEHVTVKVGAVLIGFIITRL